MAVRDDCFSDDDVVMKSFVTRGAGNPQMHAKSARKNGRNYEIAVPLHWLLAVRIHYIL